MGEKFLHLRACGVLAAAAALACMATPGSALASASWHVAPPANSGQPHYIQVADLFGPSDEEKAAAAAAAQREQAQDASIRTLTQRIGDLESALQQLTGQLEEANHRAEMLQARITQMQKDFDYKLCTLAAQQLGATSEGGEDQDNSAPALPCGSLGSAAAVGPGPVTQSPAAQPGQQGPQSYASLSPGRGGVSGPSRPDGVLGTLPAGTSLPQRQNNAAAANASAPAPQQQASLGPGGSRKEFDSAMNLLAKAQYDEARGAFRSFADSYPDDDLTPQAVYWIGAIAYVQKDYPDAARAFAEELKNYPDSVRAPESMLKLGQSLVAMKQTKEGCTTLEAVSSKYPKASRTIRRQAEDARHDAHCR